MAYVTKIIGDCIVTAIYKRSFYCVFPSIPVIMFAERYPPPFSSPYLRISISGILYCMIVSSFTVSLGKVAELLYERRILSKRDKVCILSKYCLAYWPSDAKCATTACKCCEKLTFCDKCSDVW